MGKETMQTAKIFQNGRSQAVRLPREFRLPGHVVAIFHLGKSVVLQPIYETWTDVRNAMEGLTDEDFASMLAMEDLPPEEREMF